MIQRVAPGARRRVSAGDERLGLTGLAGACYNPLAARGDRRAFPNRPPASCPEVSAMAADRKIRVAIIGLGFGAEFIPIYQHHPNAEMYAIC
ncbi:MAG: hypothetical protein ABI603_07260, partial [Acidobacteriota bacterium]